MVRANTHSHYKDEMELNIAEWTEKKVNIVETTIELVGKQGLEKLTTAKIARVAGVGEGTIYRHFESKEELIDIAAEFSASVIREHIIKNYKPQMPVELQFMGFCRDFLESGQNNQSFHEYLFHYMKSPQGFAYRKTMYPQLNEAPATAKPFFYPLNAILTQARQEEHVKDVPLQVLAVMTISSLVFVVGDSAAGLLKLDHKLIESIITACWDTVRI